MQIPKLFTLLPEYICTPDGMEIDRQGNLILSCPNYADDKMSGCVVKIDKEKNITKWFDVPVHPETGVARNMGIAFDADGSLYICDNQGWSEKADVLFKGRVLKVSFDEAGNVQKYTIVADGMEHPNGIRIRGEYMYVTQSYLSKVKIPSGKMVSCVYRFRLDDENIQITNTLDDPNILTTFVTQNPECQYGADGIAFNSRGELFVGNFGDGEVIKILLDEDGGFESQEHYAGNWEELKSTDGMIFDANDNLYIADFCANAIVKVTPDGTVARIAQSPDTDGLHGELDQPGEPIIWDGKIIASCFDLVTGPGKINTGHEMPATMSELELE